ncbi:hypothetical protein ACFQS3_18945 [Glycomyces mayteni]|uniref:Uncharacterized protein n=1 Tax=Glycomyces mayteni TaxID=543887 RepID=A0ABW2DAA4_9ACTN|nr:hypothetical protein GCM10025732_02690 [Glycomyces mayteni]
MSRLADPPVTVEPGGETTDGRTAWTTPRPAQADTPCAHTVRARDLKPAGRLLFATTVIAFVLNSLLQGLAVLFGLLELSFLIDGDMLDAAVAAAMFVGLGLTIPGGAALLRIWTRLHRPPRGIPVLHALGITAWAAGYLMLGYVTGWYPLMFLVLFALPVPALLLALGNLLYDRGTCRSHPTLPPRFQELVARCPEPQAAPPAPYRAKDCPHFVPFADLRPRPRFIAAVSPVLSVVYFAVIALYIREISLGGAQPDLAIGSAIVLLPLNFVGLHELGRCAKRLHRPGAGVFVLSLLGYLITLLLMGEGALYGLGFCWPGAILAASRAVGLIAAMRRLPKRAVCRSLPPDIPAMAMIRRAAPIAPASALRANA